MDRSLRLTHEYDIRTTRSRGRAFAAGPLVARILSRPGEQIAANRYAVVAGKQCGNAVARNRCKRLVREALRSLHPELLQGYDIVVIVRGGPASLVGLATTLATLEQILVRAQLLDRPLAPVTGAEPPARQ